jgi:hypothetical protein
MIVDDDEDDMPTDDEDDTPTDDEDDTPTVTPSGSELIVELSPETPRAQNIPQSAANVEYLTFDLTAGSEDVNVEEIVLRRVDLGSRDNFDKVWLTEDGVVISNDRTIASDDSVTFTMDYSIQAGETVTLTLNASMSSTTNVVNAFEIVSIAASTDVE